MVARTSVEGWDKPPDSLTLPSDEIHVWRVVLGLPPAALEHMEIVLSDAERERASRFHHIQHRRAFIASHAALRRILSLYVDVEPGALRFRHSVHGKPSLDRSPSEPLIKFNLAHSHTMALVAVAREREVGVDLEWVRPELANMRVAEEFFSPAELERLHALRGSAQVRGFFNCWTRKEAYVKARGEGLSMPLCEFDVSLEPGKPAELVSTRPDPQDVARWRLVDLSPGEGYVGAVAAEGQSWRVRCWQYSVSRG